jgi:tetratricopeptide (TPR) repeat protein
MDHLGKARSEPNSSIRRGELAMAYETNGYLDAALTSYEQAELLDSNEARWPYYRALMLANRGQHQQALEAMDRAINIDATHGPAWMHRGSWSLDLGFVDEASEAFTRAESLGLVGQARASQARVLLRQHRPEEAVALLETLSREYPDPSVFQLLGKAYRETGRLDDARIALARGKSAPLLTWVDDWHEQKRVYEVDFNPRLRHAKRLLARGQVDEALKRLESLIEERPDNAVAINLLSQTYARAGDSERAFWVLRRAIAKDSVDDSTLVNIAGFYEARGDHRTALEHLNRAIEINPLATLPYVRKGLMLRKQGRPEAALAAFESALRNDAGDPNVFFYAGDIEAILRNWPQAIRRFEESIHIDPSFTLGHVNLALALAKSNRFGEAYDVLDRAATLGTHEDEVQAAFGHIARLEGNVK